MLGHPIVRFFPFDSACRIQTAYVYLALVDDLRFDWDQSNTEHLARHHVTPDEVEQIFANDPDDLAYDVVVGEERWTVIGHTASLRVLVVVWTLRNEAVRTGTAREPIRRHSEVYLRARGFGL